MLFGRPLAHVDGGQTPYTDAGRAAFADYVAAVLERFPSIGTIEIGNEFNGNNFVSGPVKNAGYDLRDDYYVKLLAAVHQKISVDFPNVKILGGATHSVPVGGYLRSTFDLGALNYSTDRCAPYKSDPENIGDHLGLLKMAMGSARQPIYVTEFGDNFQSLQEAPSYLVRMVSAMAGAGVHTATWYKCARSNGIRT